MQLLSDLILNLKSSFLVTTILWMNLKLNSLHLKYVKKLIGHHTRLRESGDLFLSWSKFHRKKPPFCLCARAR